MKRKPKKSYLIKCNGEYYPGIAVAARELGINFVTLTRKVSDAKLSSGKDIFSFEYKNFFFQVKTF
jgi:hypothetical protein